MSKLTDEQIEAIYTQETGSLIDDSPWALVDFSRAIEAAATGPLLQRIAELEQRNSDLHEDVQRFKKHALNEKAARLELERLLEEARKDAERLNWLAFNPVEALDLFGHVTGDFPSWPKWIRSDIDAAMQKGQS